MRRHHFIPQIDRTPLATESEALEIFVPRPLPPVVDWLSENITIPSEFSPNDSGPFSIHSRPYQRAILECWHPNSGVTHCAVSAGAQTAKTFMLVSGLAYRLRHVALPSLLVGSSKEWAKNELSEKRLRVLIEQNPALAELMPEDSDRFRAMTMHLSGGVIQIVGGNSPGNLSGGSYGIVAIDEAAKLVRKGSEQAAEAHPIDLALMRTSAFAGSSFHYLSSTPNVTAHPFWQHVQNGSQTRFWVTCPHCKKGFFFDFIGTDNDCDDYGVELGISIPRDYRSVTWSASARQADGKWNKDAIRATVRYICPHNGCEITEAERFGMILGCYERSHNEAAASTHRSFIIPSFMAPPVTFGALALEFLEAQVGDGFSAFALQSFYNNRRAIPFETIKRKIDAAQVLKLKGDHARGVIPSRPKHCFIAADPGENATHWMFCALLQDGNLAVIDWGTALSIEELDSDDFRAARQYPIAGTNETERPLFGLVDSRFLPRRVFDMCQRRQNQPRHWSWWPSRGTQNRSGIWTQSKVQSHQSLVAYAYSDHNLKCELYGEIFGNERKPGVLLPVDCEVVKPEDGRGLLSGLVGQTLVRVGEGDHWKRMAHDHFGDTLKLCLLATAIANAGGGESDGERIR